MNLYRLSTIIKEKEVINLQKLSEDLKEQYFIGKENKLSTEHLMENKENIIIIGFGQSMTPILKSGQPCIIEPITEETNLSKNDIVFCKVNGHYYLHKITAIKNKNSYQISNNHGHVNGWISIKNIYGKMIKKL